jgi:hypothetical protein
MGVSRLAGRYSAVSKPKTPIAREKTAVQAGNVVSSALAARLEKPAGTEPHTHSLIKAIHLKFR